MSEENDVFWAMLTNRRDQGLASLTTMIENNGLDEICQFLSKHVMPGASDDSDPQHLVNHVICHMAIVGAVDAMLAWRDAHQSV